MKHEMEGFSSHTGSMYKDPNNPSANTGEYTLPKAEEEEKACMAGRGRSCNRHVHTLLHTQRHGADRHGGGTANRPFLPLHAHAHARTHPRTHPHMDASLGGCPVRQVLKCADCGNANEMQFDFNYKVAASRGSP